MTDAFLLEKQSQDKWCWAAVSVSVARYFLPLSPLTQCRVALAVTGKTDCCGSGRAGCNEPGDLEVALKAVARWKGNAQGRAHIRRDSTADRRLHPGLRQNRLARGRRPLRDCLRLQSVVLGSSTGGSGRSLLCRFHPQLPPICDRLWQRLAARRRPMDSHIYGPRDGRRLKCP